MSAHRRGLRGGEGFLPRRLNSAGAPRRHEPAARSERQSPRRARASARQPGGAACLTRVAPSLRSCARAWRTRERGRHAQPVVPYRQNRPRQPDVARRIQRGRGLRRWQRRAGPWPRAHGRRRRRAPDQARGDSLGEPGVPNQLRGEAQRSSTERPLEVEGGRARGQLVAEARRGGELPDQRVQVHQVAQALVVLARLRGGGEALLQHHVRGPEHPASVSRDGDPSPRAAAADLAAAARWAAGYCDARPALTAACGAPAAELVRPLAVVALVVRAELFISSLRGAGSASGPRGGSRAAPGCRRPEN